MNEICSFDSQILNRLHCWLDLNSLRPLHICQ